MFAAKYILVLIFIEHRSTSYYLCLRSPSFFLFKSDVKSKPINRLQGENGSRRPLRWESKGSAGTVQTWYHLPGKGQLKEQARLFVSRSLTLPFTPPWAGGVIRWFSLSTKIKIVPTYETWKHYKQINSFSHLWYYSWNHRLNIKYFVIFIFSRNRGKWIMSQHIKSKEWQLTEHTRKNIYIYNR